MTNVIIPVFNALDTLPKALDSLVAQTEKKFIVTIAQDCDGLDYSSILNEYKRRGLFIRRIVTPHNGGPGYARQCAMDVDRQCEYFIFLDADDMLMPRTVEILKQAIAANGSDIVTSDFIIESSDGPARIVAAEDIPVTWMHGKIYRKSFLVDNNIKFLENLRVNEDSYFNLVCYNCTKKIFTLKEPTYIWRNNKQSLTRNDGTEGYFAKGWENYIESQVRGLEKIHEITWDIPGGTFAATIINIYNTFEEAKYKGYDTTNMYELLHELRNNKKVQSLLNTPDFWLYISKDLKPCKMVEDTLIFFRDIFSDWVTQHISHKEEDNESISC